MGKTIFEWMEERSVLLDGGMGTELIRRGFPQGECPESWNIKKPEVVQSIHENYFEAGSDVVLTNSFGGSRTKLAEYNLGNDCFDLNRAAAVNATQVKPEGKFVGGSMGPTGKFLKPTGECTEEEFEEGYAEQARGLSEGGVDFLVIETQYDLNEALCAFRGVKKVSDLPVFVTMTFNHHARGFFTLMGNSAEQCIQTLEKAGAAVVGSNCTINSEEMVELVQIMRSATSLPLLAQANAGKPSLSEDGEVHYSQGIEDYLRFIPKIVENGANLVGGCCGTDPEYIRRMAKIIVR